MTTNQIVEHINKHNYSPFEALLYAHKVLSRTDCLECIPTIASKALSEQMNQIIEELNNPNISSKIVECSLYEKGKNHSDVISYFHNLIKIHDSNYFIDGYYANDAYADSNQKGFTHLLFPAEDLVHLNNYSYQGIIQTGIVSEYLPLSSEPKCDRHNHQISKPDYMSICTNHVPFAIPTFIRAMKRVFQTAPELFENQDFTEMLYNELSKSATTAKLAFDNNASSAFVTYAYSPVLNPQQNSSTTEDESES